MRTLVTGASGFIGSRLTLSLAAKGEKVNALYRNEARIKGLIHPDITLIRGDILDKECLRAALSGCNQIYHLAAFASKWIKDQSRIYEINVIGTKNILDLSMEFGIKDIVFTSSAGVFGPSDHGVVTETTMRKVDFFSEYERTKTIAEQLVREYISKGLNIRIVNPTRVYGPGVLDDSNSVTKIIDYFLKGKWHIIPGNGKSIGSYVYVDDVVDGHILAMKNGKAGENYLLGGENVDYLTFFKLVSQLSGEKRFLIKLPYRMQLFAAKMAKLSNKLLGISPFITEGLINKYNCNWEVCSTKAISELGYTFLPLESGIRKTIQFLGHEALYPLLPST